MRRKAFVFSAVAAMGLVVGCAQHREEVRRDATVAALAKYPGNVQKSDRVQVAAVDYREDKRLELLNLGDGPVENPMIWVNKTYVNKAPTIPTRGSIVVKYVDLIQQGQGVQDLATTNQPVQTVEIQTADGLYSAMGPARK